RSQSTFDADVGTFSILSIFNGFLQCVEFFKSGFILFTVRRSFVADQAIDRKYLHFKSRYLDRDAVVGRVRIRTDTFHLSEQIDISKSRIKGKVCSVVQGRHIPYEGKVVGNSSWPRFKGSQCLSDP